MDYSAARKVMVDSQVRVNDVTDRGLHAALLTVPRERFCAPDKAWAAYAEVEVEIAGDRKLMMARDVAKLLQGIQPRAGEKALAIAAPYAAAVLARLGVSVTAQDSDQAVLDVVADGLSDAGVSSVLAPLSQPSGEDYDIIVSEVGVAARPETWVAALKIGGRLAVVERSDAAGKAVLYIRGREGVSRRELFDSNPEVVAEMAPAPAFAF
jgi:protein-L-isoaspartate(D-aspartate) O-methyltransferase